MYATNDTSARADIENMFLCAKLKQYVSLEKLYQYTASLPMPSNETFVTNLYCKNKRHHIMTDYNYNQLRQEMIDYYRADTNVSNIDFNLWLYAKIYWICIKYEVKHELSVEEGIQGNSVNLSQISIDLLHSDTLYVKLIKPYGNNVLKQDVCFVIGEWSYRTDFSEKADEFLDTQRCNEYNWTTILPTSLRPLTYDESYLYEIVASTEH